jgi:hypothetical protein
LGNIGSHLDITSRRRGQQAKCRSNWASSKATLVPKGIHASYPQPPPDCSSLAANLRIADIRPEPAHSETQFDGLHSAHSAV